jgi:hypothetical protein
MVTPGGVWFIILGLPGFILILILGLISIFIFVFGRLRESIHE